MAVKFLLELYTDRDKYHIFSYIMLKFLQGHCYCTVECVVWFAAKSAVSSQNVHSKA